MRAHSPVALCSGHTYIIVNKKTRLVLDDPVSEAGSVTVNRLSENDTQKVWCPVSYRYPHVQLTSSLYRSGCFLRTETAFGLFRTSETANSFAFRNLARQTETLLSRSTATRRYAVGPSSPKTV